jgi:hypothetical protein
MIETPACYKKYNSAKVRFLKGALVNFFEREFPKFFGPLLREKLTEELIHILEKTLPLKDHLKSGQMVWNALDIRTRADSKNPKYVPVILTIINENDIEKLSKGEKIGKVREHAIARIHNEAYEQGALLSVRDISLFSWRYDNAISIYRKNYEKEHDVILPHPGSLQDMGSCISHKTVIVRKVVLENKDPLAVANATKHTIKAVDRYLKDFYRVKYCFDDNKDIDFIVKTTGISKFVVKQYLEILKEHKIEKNKKST